MTNLGLKYISNHLYHNLQTQNISIKGFKEGQKQLLPSSFPIKFIICNRIGFDNFESKVAIFILG